MIFKYGIAALGLMLSGSVFAAVTLSVPEEIVVLAVNDQEVNSGLIRKQNEYKVLENTGNSVYFVSPYKVYLNGTEIKGADAKTFQIVSSSTIPLSRDKDSYYKDHTVITKAEYDKYRRSR